MTDLEAITVNKFPPNNQLLDNKTWMQKEPDK